MLPETGISSVILARETESGQIAMAAFLVDAFALGIKDAMFDVVEHSDFKFQISLLNEGAPLVPVEPSRARKLLRDAAAYAASLGLRPHRGFVATEQLFGDVRAEDCSETFAFGHDGKPVYMVGPSETAAQIVRRLENMTERLGPGGFDLVIPAGDEVEEGADADS